MYKVASMNFSARLICCVSALLATPAWAGIDEVYSPLFTPHELEFEYKGSRLGDGGKSLNNAQTHEVEAAYGVTDTLRLGLLGIGGRSSGQSFEADGFGAQVLYTAARQGPYWLNVGVMGEYVAATHANSPDQLEARLLLSRVQGPYTINANLIFGRELGPNRSSGTGFGSSAQALYAVSKDFSAGVEWYGDFGNFGHFSDANEQHYIGPVIAGELAEFEHSDIGYSAGYFWGLTRNSADQGARIEIDYGIQF